MIPVTCAIIYRNGKILAAQRAEGHHLAGQWEFPGGKVDEGETEEACIVREIREELGIEVRPTRRLGESHHDYSDRTIRLIPFVCDLVNGEPKAGEHRAITWLGPDELPSVPWCDADLPIVKQLSAENS